MVKYLVYMYFGKFYPTTTQKYSKREDNMAKIDKATLDHIAALSKLSFTDEESEAMAEQMGDIIALMDTIRDIDIEYDDTKDNNQIAYKELREDKPNASFPTEKLMQNAVTGGDGDCYVMPKMME